MTGIEKIGAFGIITTFLLTSYSIYLVKKHNYKILVLENENKRMNKEYNQLVKGQNELTIQTLLSNTKKVVIDYCSYIAENETNDLKKKENRQKILWGHTEENLNAYERACSLYLDEKVDKERFKKNYFKEIMLLMESDDILNRFFGNSNKIKFPAIEKVYNEWFYLEK